MIRLLVYQQKRYYVYALALPQNYYDDGNDPSDVVFYIGKGTGDRIDSHEMEAENNSSTWHPQGMPLHFTYQIKFDRA